MKTRTSHWPDLHAVVFDMDDTLINWKDAERLALADVSREHLEPLGIAPETTRAAYQAIMLANVAQFRATGKWQYIAERLAALSLSLGTADAAPGPVLANHFTNRIPHHLALLPGALEAIEAARHDGRKVGMLTNGPSHIQRPKMDRLGLTDRFDFVGVTGEIGAWKPSPAAFAFVLEKLGVAPEHTLMVGDSEDFDVVPAKRLGMATAWVCNPVRSHPDADVVVAGPAGLVPLLAAAKRS